MPFWSFCFPLTLSLHWSKSASPTKLWTPSRTRTVPSLPVHLKAHSRWLAPCVACGQHELPEEMKPALCPFLMILSLLTKYEIYLPPPWAFPTLGANREQTPANVLNFTFSSPSLLHCLIPWLVLSCVPIATHFLPAWEKEYSTADQWTLSYSSWEYLHFPRKKSNI
jgi:hypothetical protein